MPGAGDLRERIAFEMRVDADDGAGNRKGKFVEQFVCWAAVTAFRGGGEEVSAARLAGRQPVVIKVRWGARTKRITTAWRARDANTGEIYNIRTKPPAPKRDFFLLHCESGAAVAV